MTRLPAVFLAAVALAAAPGCFLFDAFNAPIEIPLDLTSPEQEFDVDGPVAEAESSACVTPSAPSCLTLTAICETGDNPAACASGPTMPPEFPKEFQVGTETVTADEAMENMGMTEATQMEVALPVDVGAQLKDAGVSDTSAIEEVTIDKVVMLWPTNTLTFDTPPTDLYISTEALTDPENVDAQQLIADGKVEKIGTLGIDLDGDDAFDVGQVAGSTDEVPVEFVSGGKEKFNEAVKSASFTLVTASTSPVTLKEVDGDATQVRKPAGAGKIQLKATLVYKVSAADVVDKAAGE